MAFLMQQMEWREELGDARAGKDSDALESLDKQLARRAQGAAGADRTADQRRRFRRRRTKACAR